jgi:DNA-binding MarR family transcriptional regulator
VSSEDDATPWLSPEELSAWMGFSAMLLTMPTAIDAQLKRDAGMNLFEYTVLAGLSEIESRCTRMANLAALSAGSPSRLSHAVARLERQGWLERRPQPEGAPRSTDVYLTDAGFDALKAAAPGHVREVRRLVLDGLTSAQIGQLGRISRQLLDISAPETAALIERRRTLGN